MSAPAAARDDRLADTRAELLRASAALEREGMPGTSASGQLIRPLVALAGVRGGALPPGFWQGVLAVQLAHEASLVHDDIIDAAAERRSAPTAAAATGVPRALVYGDHLLTAAYRAAASTGSTLFMTLFARAVERTVAWEVVQGRCAGEVLDRRRYDEIALGKAGELLGCALAVAPALEAREDVHALFELGRRIGLLYQMFDDLLDYCPLTSTGKPALGDYAQHRWTWLLEEAPALRFGLPGDAALAALHGCDSRGSAAQRAIARLEAEAETLRAALREHRLSAHTLEPMLDGWLARAREATEREAAHRRAPARSAQPVRPAVAWLEARVPAPLATERYLASHSRSFRFAARFFGSADAERVARVYAYCRVTDDIVDRPRAGERPDELLATWTELSRRAYDGEPCGLAFLDRVMGEMAAAGVPFAYADELAAGMRMDLRSQRYATLPELRLYTYRVASVVGLWLTRLFGVHDAAVLERAERLGHAMQLTNILRDVGEDWRRGRLYLPADLLRRHGVDEAELGRMDTGAPPSPAYRALTGELLAVAETDYRAALDAVPLLPSAFARPVAVAAHVYRGIHREIRRNGYDNFRHRAYTAPATKAVLAARALWELQRTTRTAPALVLAAVPLPGGGGD